MEKNPQVKISNNNKEIMQGMGLCCQTDRLRLNFSVVSMEDLTDSLFYGKDFIFPLIQYFEKTLSFLLLLKLIDL